MKKLLVTVNGTTYEVEVEIIEEDSDSEMPIPQAYQPTTSVMPQMPPKPTFGQTQTTMTDKILRAPMNGKVIGVKVQVNENVESGQVVIELEAMKMKSNIYAPGGGQIKAIFVNSGDSVESGQNLLEYM
jgi:biotin carboxyl carrier protein